MREIAGKFAGVFNFGPLFEWWAIHVYSLAFVSLRVLLVVSAGVWIQEVLFEFDAHEIQFKRRQRIGYSGPVNDAFRRFSGYVLEMRDVPRRLISFQFGHH